MWSVLSEKEQADIYNMMTEEEFDLVWRQAREKDRRQGRLKSDPGLSKSVQDAKTYEERRWGPGTTIATTESAQDGDRLAKEWRKHLKKHPDMRVCLKHQEPNYELEDTQTMSENMWSGNAGSETIGASFRAQSSQFGATGYQPPLRPSYASQGQQHLGFSVADTF